MMVLFDDGLLMSGCPPDGYLLASYSDCVVSFVV